MSNRGKEFLHQNEKAIEIMIGLNESMRSISSEEVISLIIADNGLIPLLIKIIQEVPGLTIKSLKLFGIMFRNSFKLTLEFINSGIIVIKNVIEKGLIENNFSIISEILQVINSIIPNDHENSVRTSFFLENKNFLLELSEIIFPQILSIYETITKKNIKNLFLEILYNIIQNLTPEAISNFNQFPLFLSNLLVEKDSGVLKSALKIISMLYDKIPEFISTKFIREGVVQRFKALKQPENLKNITEDKFADPLEFEHFLINYRRSRTYSDQEIPSNHIRPRLLSECRDGNYDQKKEIIYLSKLVIDKHNSCRNKSALSTGKTLKNLASALEKLCSNNADDIWNELAETINNFNPTAYEFSTSDIVESI